MKVQTRLTLFTTSIFGIVFLLSSLFIYAFYAKSAKERVYQDLDKNAYLTAFFYLEEDELNKHEYSKVKNQFNEYVTNSFYQVYDERNEVKYGSDQYKIPLEVRAEIRKKGEKRFEHANFYCYGIYYEDNEGNFIVVTKEKKEVVSQQLTRLLGILGIALLLGVITIYTLSRWISNLAYKPFRKAIVQANNISTNNLDAQITVPQTSDELQDLIETFNSLLKRIAETFIIQKNFVRYVSHEFKTPLASLMGNLEVFALRDRSPQEYKKIASLLLEDVHQLKDTLDTLLVVSDTQPQNTPNEKIRIDELIWQVVDKVKANRNNASILVNLEIPSPLESLLVVRQNRAQLFIALYNIIDNAVKYSQEKEVSISLKHENKSLAISIQDYGIGIPPSQLENISKPFYRAANASWKQGSGIGLSIALRVLEKNKIDYNIDSQEGVGTIVKLLFNTH